MYRDPTEFRQRFLAYKEGKAPYENGLPKYAEGTPSYDSTIDFLKRYEGFKDTTYLDGNGIPTIGYGFTDSSLVKKGTISRAEADRRLKQEVAARESVLSKMKNWDKLSEDSKTALRSYYYNYPAGFKPTTKFMKAWNAGNYEEAIRQVDAGMYDKKNPGLRKRRLEEQALLKADPFLRPVLAIQPTPIVNPSVSTAVHLTIPEEAVVPDPYIPSRRTVRLLPPVKLPNLIEMLGDSEWLPNIGFKNGKLPRFETGTIPYTFVDGTQYNINPNVVGAELLNIDVPEVVITGTDRRPMYQRYDAEHSSYDPEAIRTFTDWAPVVSDIGDGLDAYNAFKNKDWMQLSMIGAGFLLPNVLERALKPAWKFVGPTVKKYIDPLVDRISSRTKQLSIPSNISVEIPHFTEADFNFEHIPDWREATINGATPESIIASFDSRLPYATNANRPLVRAVPSNRENNQKLVDHYLLLIQDKYPDAKKEDLPRLFLEIHGATTDDVLNARGMTVVNPDTRLVEYVTYNEGGDKTRSALTKTHEENHTMFDLEPGQYNSEQVTKLDSPLGVERNYLNENAGFLLPDFSDPNHYNGIEEYLSADEVSSFMSEYKSLLGKTGDEKLTKEDIEWFIKNHKIVGTKTAQYRTYKSIADRITDAKKFANWCNEYSNVIAALAVGGAVSAAASLPEYKNGKPSIHINPANRGKFNATKKRTGKTTEELAHSKNPLTRKRAIFALNARKWKH